MKISLIVASVALLALGGCETMFEDTLIQRDTVSDQEGIYIYSDLSESAEGDRFWNFWATNNNSFPVCVGLTLGKNSTTSGHEFDGVHYIAPGQTKGVGYVYAPADFTIQNGAWNPDSSGNC